MGWRPGLVPTRVPEALTSGRRCQGAGTRCRHSGLSGWLKDVTMRG